MPQQYKYRVKIINPQAKKDFSIIDWHGVTERFKTPLQLKLKLISTLEQYVPPASSIETFSVGYFCGRPQAKKWIVSSDDLDAMYLGGAEILLWCDGKSANTSNKRKDDASDAPPPKRSTYSSCEEELDKLVEELQKVHNEKYNYVQYKLWARMIKSGQWSDKETPPNLPMITGKAAHKEKRNDVAETIATAAVAVVRALQSPTQSTPTKQDTIQKTNNPPEGISPGKRVQLRSQYLKQLKDIQLLRDDGVLTAEEFQAEKNSILKTLKSI